MTVLIITHSQDNESIPLVTEAIKKQGGKAFRFDTDRFPTDIKLEVYYGKKTERLLLSHEQEKLSLTDVSAVWYRRIAIGEGLPSTMEPQLRQASIKESRATIMGMIASIKAFHLDWIPSIRLAENKQLQLQVARELGLNVPRTLTSNNPEAVKLFAQECHEGIVVKMLSSFAIYEQGQEKVVFTNRIETDDLAALDGLRFCPMTFQELIPKALELRVTIVGKHIFTASIDSQRLEKSRYDWRRQGIALLKDWKFYDLPDDIKQKLFQLMEYLGLNYGAIDLIVTPNEEYFFLEINPVGEFFWLELCPGLPISEAIADILLKGKS